MPAFALLRGPPAAGVAPARPSTSRPALAPSLLGRRRATRPAAGISLGEESAFADAPRDARPLIPRRQVYRSFEDDPEGGEEDWDDDEGGEWEDEDGADGVDFSAASARSSGLLGPDGRPYDVPKSAYGLTLRQMDALGLAGAGGPGLKTLGLDPVSAGVGGESEGEKTKNEWVSVFGAAAREEGKTSEPGRGPEGRGRPRPILTRQGVAE